MERRVPRHRDLYTAVEMRNAVSHSAQSIVARVHAFFIYIFCMGSDLVG